MSETPKTKEACVAAGGTWDEETQTCKLPSADALTRNIVMDLADAKEQLAAVTAKYDALKGVHSKLMKLVEDQERASLIKKLKPHVNLADHEFSGMDTTELTTLWETVRIVKKPYAGVKGDNEDTDKPMNITVGSRFRDWKEK